MELTSLTTSYYTVNTVTSFILQGGGSECMTLWSDHFPPYCVPDESDYSHPHTHTHTYTQTLTRTFQRRGPYPTRKTKTMNTGTQKLYIVHFIETHLDKDRK